MMKKSRRHLLYDPFILSRVKQYLEDNTHLTHVNVSDMARSLQDKYRDYNRRKNGPFRQLVEQAYQIVNQSYGMGSNSNSDIDEDQSEGSIELLDEDTETEGDPPSGAAPNLLGDVMNSLYTKKTPQEGSSQGGGIPANTIPTAPPPPVISNPPPIDISSDEEGGGDQSSENQAMEHYSRPNGDLVFTRPAGQVVFTRVEQPHQTNGQNREALDKSVATGDSVPQQVNKKRKINAIQAPALSLVKSGTSSNNATTASGSKKSSASNSKKDFPIKTSTLSFSDVGGLEKILKELCELLLHLKHPELYEHIGVAAPRGFLLHGPPGSGKTLLANAIAGQLKVPLLEVAATELVAGISGESEERIREVFEKAASVAPCVLFIDEVDVVSGNRNNAQKDLERRIVSQLLSSLDGLGQMPNGNKVVVVGATNRADILDPALRRVGRFDQEICLGIPDRQAREQILRIVCKTLRLEEPFSFDELAVLTPGYVGADLLALAMRAATIAVRRAFSKRPKVEEEVEKEKEEKEKDEMDEKEREVEEMKGTTTTEEPKANEVKETATEDDHPMEVDVTEEKPTEEAPAISSVPSAVSEETPLKIDDEETKLTSGENPTSELDQQPMEEEKKEISSETPANNPATPITHSLAEMLEWLNSENDGLLTKEDIEALRVTMFDFQAALRVVQPSAKREGFITVPDVTWDDIGSLGDIRDELKLAILAPVRYPKKLERLGLQSPSGVLLCGPPGCGKTLLAKAVANEAGINFISVKGPELLNMYVGESERAVRQCFQRAKNSAPCVIFFDEFDALCPKRSSRSDNTGGARVVNQLLTEMDGVEDRRGVFLMAATNRPDMIDGAVLRPGRLDKILYVGLPECNDREDILRALTKVS